MSWDVVLFNSSQKIASIEELDEGQLIPIDFHEALKKHFSEIKINENHAEINGSDFSIDYFVHSEPVSNTLLNLYGEKGLYELVIAAKVNNWQIFDTSLGSMIDLDHAEVNGFTSFQNYLAYILKDN
jgi:hypothetical protein